MALSAWPELNPGLRRSRALPEAHLPFRLAALGREDIAFFDGAADIDRPFDDLAVDPKSKIVLIPGPGSRR